MFDLAEFQGNKLNAEYLKSLPSMAVKALIKGGGVANFKDGTKSPYLKVVSPSGQWDGEKEALLNKTNLAILKAAYGTNPGAWIDREVGFFFDPTVTFGGKVTGGMKVRPIVPDPFATQATPTPTQAVAEDSVPF